MGRRWGLEGFHFDSETCIRRHPWVPHCCPLKGTPDLHGCPPVSSGKKIRMRAILKEGTANYISLESLINVDFGKKYEQRKLQK